ncbi:MAG: hemerythrin domain-containing protein [Candidatus Pacearchaeota archaeon]|nr:hemerythrin domain-containing protein [Candidatus Pacearchaeota archaeon]
MNNITKEMIAQHQLVNRILLDFEKVPENDLENIRNIFTLFKDNWMRHMLLEENNIFPITDENNMREKRELNNLLKDHKDLKEIIFNLEEDVKAERKPDIKVFREMLISHEDREIQGFYPLLDKRLSTEDKNKILQTIKNVKLRY